MMKLRYSDFSKRSFKMPVISASRLENKVWNKKQRPRHKIRRR